MQALEPPLVCQPSKDRKISPREIGSQISFGSGFSWKETKIKPRFKNDHTRFQFKYRGWETLHPKALFKKMMPKTEKTEETETVKADLEKLGLAINISHIIGLAQDGKAYIWESCSSEDQSFQNPPKVLRSPNGHRWASFSCTDYSSVGITENGEAFVWGSGLYGQLGLGDEKDKVSPTLLRSPNGSKWKDIYCGSKHMIGITESGIVFAWGWNRYGQLGLGDTLDSHSPRWLRCPNMSGWKWFSLGWAHSIGFTNDGKTFGWGRNAENQLEPFDIRSKTLPIPLELPSELPWKVLSCGNTLTIGIITNGILYARGGIYQVNYPKETWISVACSQTYATLLTSEGKGILFLSHQLFSSPLSVPQSPDGNPWKRFISGPGTNRTIGMTTNGDAFAWELNGSTISVPKMLQCPGGGWKLDGLPFGWNPSNHTRYSREIRNRVKMLVMLGRRKWTNIPRDLLYTIISLFIHLEHGVNKLAN